jgi:hypothetical protein
MTAAGNILTASSVLFGFFFAGFWWALNRELTFKPRQRHFKYGYVLLLLSMALLAWFGIVQPLRSVVAQDPSLAPGLYGVTVALVGVFGYMLTELGHYSIFQRPKYATGAERFFFWLTLLAITGITVWWLGAQPTGT